MFFILSRISLMRQGNNVTSRDWCGTVFGDGIQSVLDAGRDGSTSGSIRYLVGQKEMCPDTQRLHLQFFVRFKDPKRLQGAKQALGDVSIHLERRRGTPQQAADYCRKNETRAEGDDSGPFEWGSISRQGTRSDLEEVRRSITEGMDEREVADTYFSAWVRYGSSFTRYRNMLYLREINSEPPDVRVYWGPTGTGKTRCAWNEFPNLYPVPVPSARSQPWFDNYCGQEVVLIDDFHGYEYQLTFLLRLLDRYPLQVPVKTSFANWCPKIIIITSNIPPADWYPDEPAASRAALLRRISSITDYAITSRLFTA